ncbi:MAG: START domain-containing protein [Acidobacteriota bacterium]
MAKAVESFGPWDTVSDDGGVKVEVRKHKKTGLVETRASGVIAAASDVLWKAMTTPESYLAIMKKTKESRHLSEKPRSREVVCYQRLDGSPAGDRDYTLFIKWTAEDTSRGKRYTRTWSVRNDLGPPPVKDVVRVEVNDGSWTLEPVEAKKTMFTQVSYVELGGSMWAVLANTAVKESAREAFRTLRAKFPG